jgi:preprotein translocase SecF subunit
MVYVAFRFKKIGGLSAGAMAVLALVHDVIVAFGVFVIFRIPINDNFIAVVLTILGFSLNDTIVIYDRIRENETLVGKQMGLGELMDLSVNQSFSRSLVTSVNAILAMIVVTVVAMIYSVDTIISFSFPLIIGLISGSYSSICLAGPLWVKWQEYKANRATATGNA